MKQLGRLPRRGESASIDGFEFRVLRADRRRIDALRVQAPRDVLPPEERPPAATAEPHADGRRHRRAAPAAARCRLPPPQSARCALLLAAVAGLALAGSFAPLDLWPLAVLAPALLMWLWQGAAPREAARLGFAFSSGDLRRRHLLALHQHPRVRAGAGVARAAC